MLILVHKEEVPVWPLVTVERVWAWAEGGGLQDSCQGPSLDHYSG